MTVKVMTQPALFCAACGDRMVLTGYQPGHLVSRKQYREVTCKNSHCDQFDKLCRLAVTFYELDEVPVDERRS
jgi:hypothetical protein